MQLTRLLHKTFENELVHIHKKRLNALFTAVSALTIYSSVTLTALGRNIQSKAQVRSNIKKMDRLLGNHHLWNERESIYALMAHRLIGADSRALIHVDWSCICAQTKLYLLRASLCMSGRSIVLYEECHTKKGENNHCVHKAFLRKLKGILPQTVKPIIVTDAGFRAPWFDYITTLGWDFVGRLRNKNLIVFDGKKKGCLGCDLYPLATPVPTCLGQGKLTEKRQVPANIVLYSTSPKNRHKYNINKKVSRSGKSKLHSKSHREPWLLVTSLDNKNVAYAAVAIYRQRMRIEENFRDTKSARYGLGLSDSLSRCPKRMNILLLICAIASFAAWIAGVTAKESGIAHTFQAHSAKISNAISTVFLGREALKKRFAITAAQFRRGLLLLYNMAVQTRDEVYTYA